MHEEIKEYINHFKLKIVKYLKKKKFEYKINKIIKETFSHKNKERYVEITYLKHKENYKK